MFLLICLLVAVADVVVDGDCGADVAAAGFAVAVVAIVVVLIVVVVAAVVV